MKKLGKLTINPDKIIKNEELVNLRGGYGDEKYLCKCNPPAIGTWIGYYDSQAEVDAAIEEWCDPLDGGYCESIWW